MQKVIQDWTLSDFQAHVLNHFHMLSLLGTQRTLSESIISRCTLALNGQRAQDSATSPEGSILQSRAPG